VLLSAFGFVLLCITWWALLGSPQYLEYAMALYLLVVGNALFPTWLYQGMERMTVISVVNVAAKVAAVLALFAFVKRASDGLAAATILGGSGMLAGLMGALYAVRFFRLGRPACSWAGVVWALRDGWHVFLSRAAVSLYTSGNAFLLGLVSPAEQVGYFGAAEKVVRGVLGLWEPLGRAVYPRLSQLAVFSPGAALREARVLLVIMGGFGAALTVAVLASAGLVARALSGGDFGSIALCMRVLAPVIFLVAVNHVLGVQVLLPLGKDREFARILACAGILNVVLGLALGRRWGSVGMAGAVLFAETVVTVGMAARVVRAVSYSRRSEG
jgi:PST family polysaccharide transporter